ncbi:hypothetical protein J132_05461 [Termitomyces sp. J132]|nr:hypothetical protein H2248_000889 [Termitomyces sp. 'cryptogamus']KNZ77445.1 hypothetical protein J132_05461 [Termitomyces sp. J132]
MPSRIESAPRLGGSITVVLFIAILLAFVVQSELTQYVQTILGYRQPFFLLYVVHSSFALIFPLHALYLILFQGYSAASLRDLLCLLITDHLAPSSPTKFPFFPFLRLALMCTLGLTLPALLWYTAITLASVSDVTAIWNTNAFFAYVISVKLFGLKWEPRRLLAVLLATLGVIAVVYGGSIADQNEESSVQTPQPSGPLAGDLLTLVASIGYGLYQVLYKKYAALSTDPDVVSDDLYERLPNGDPAELHSDSTPLNVTTRQNGVPNPPFGLHANFLTCIIGLITLLVLWLPIPFLHYLGAEPFILPSDMETILVIAGISLSGMIFNAGFMASLFSLRSQLDLISSLRYFLGYGGL